MMLNYEVPMQHETSSDEALVKRVQTGDKRAFDLLVLKYQHQGGCVNLPLYSGQARGAGCGARQFYQSISSN